ncbi:hypothetical protein ACQ4M3_13090 [Leptolyngbya sp. AN03gr2]|uniref:hypothetical protein n=1 Tax=unclassified Leptolyngbya TaxID=2650499 RepID=UPI003D3236C4
MAKKKPKKHKGTEKQQMPSIEEICSVTGLVFCDENCGCGENSHLFFTPVCEKLQSFVPDLNGIDYSEVAEWFLKNELYRGFRIFHETECDYYAIAIRSEFSILVDYDARIYRSEIGLSEAMAEAEDKLRILIDAWHQDSSVLERLPQDWQTGYKFDEASVQQLRDEISRLIPAPGQLTLI